jgi:AcrR family transcriptional regulator
MTAAADAEKRKAIDTIEAYLCELRATRPSVGLAAERSQKGAKTLRAILLAAREVFTREGHGGLSMRKVAEEAGVAVGNVSYYFETKRELIEATLRETLADYVEEQMSLFEGDRDSPIEILLSVVDFYVGTARRNHRFFFQLWGYTASCPDALRLIRDLYRPMGRFVYYLVRATNPALSDETVRRVVLQLVALEEGVRLFIGMGPETDPALVTAGTHIRDLARRIVEEAR